MGAAPRRMGPSTRAPASGPGTVAAKVQPPIATQVPFLVRLPPGLVKEAFSLLPSGACLRFLCHPMPRPDGTPIPGLAHNCPAQCSSHPLFRPGGVCGRLHTEPAGGWDKLPWLVWAIGLSAGGLRCGPLPPRDPVKCQQLAEEYLANHRNGVPLPTTCPVVVASVPQSRLRNTALGWTGEHGSWNRCLRPGGGG